MKSTSLVSLATVILLTVGVAQAGDDKANHVIDQNLSKRPYQALPADANVNKANEFEAATLVKQEADNVKSGPTKHQQLRIRMLGQRPYMEKSTD